MCVIVYMYIYIYIYIYILTNNTVCGRDRDGLFVFCCGVASLETCLPLNAHAHRYPGSLVRVSYINKGIASTSNTDKYLLIQKHRYA